MQVGFQGEIGGSLKVSSFRSPVAYQIPKARRHFTHRFLVLIKTSDIILNAKCWTIQICICMFLSFVSEIQTFQVRLFRPPTTDQQISEHTSL